MAKNLLIVESPAKAKTIERYLGKDFKVVSSFGHIRDLPRKNMGIDIDKEFQPKYEITPDKRKVVKSLKDELKKVETVWLATDEDREGEAISWHLCEVLGLDLDLTNRIVFREITKPAIQNAIKNPRNVDMDIVNAQQARRVLDRLVGFELSQLLWRKVKGKLSAGRVQSIAVKLIVEREREIRKFESTSFFKVFGYFPVKNTSGQMVTIRAELNRKIPDENETMAFLDKLKNADFSIDSIDKKPFKRNPPPPFITSSLQQEASRKLGFNVTRTMRTAQRLYEVGAITYMRTDSTALSSLAINTIKNEICEEFGEKYSKVRQFSRKKPGAQEAHEAIRPTYINRREAGSDADQLKLYNLIWKRTVASQMASAELERTNVKIGISNESDSHFMAVGEMLKFDGFLKIYIEGVEDKNGNDQPGILPPLKVGQPLIKEKIEGLMKYTKPNARYSEAMLVKKLETLGIGRPSTYAPTISRIMEPERGYIVKDRIPGKERESVTLTLTDAGIERKLLTEMTGGSSNKLHPTDLAMIVIDFLEDHFGKIMDYGFTADIEDQLDQIAAKGKVWNTMIKDFYQPFHEIVEDTLENSKRVKARRVLGKDPDSGHTVLVQLSKYGPVVQIGTIEEVGEEGKPKFANLNPDQSMELITYDEAMELFKLPRTIGVYEGKDVEVNAGRYGPYVKYNEQFISLPRGSNPMDIELEEAIVLIQAKQKENQPICFYKELPVTKGKGRFGPYLKWNGLFANIPKKISMDEITNDEALDLVKKKEEKEANRFIQKWEKEGIAIENGRWGPFIRFKKKAVKLPKKKGEKLDPDQLKQMKLDEVKQIIEKELPGSFKKKRSSKSKK